MPEYKILTVFPLALNLRYAKMELYADGEISCIVQIAYLTRHTFPMVFAQLGADAPVPTSRELLAPNNILGK